MLKFYNDNYDQAHMETNDVEEYQAAMFSIFHDIIYDPKSKTNENDSVEVYKDFIASLSQFGTASELNWVDTDDMVISLC